MNREGVDRQIDREGKNEQRMGKETKGEVVKKRTEIGGREEQRGGERDK